jgi:hypothetical protein
MAVITLIIEAAASPDQMELLCATTVTVHQTGGYIGTVEE